MKGDILMQFPNAARGVKKLFTAEILGLVSTVILVLSTATLLVFSLIQAFLTMRGEATDLSTLLTVSAIVTGVISIAAFVVMLVSAILSIIGMAQAGKDEPAFRTALIFTIIGLVASVVMNVLLIAMPAWRTALQQLNGLFDNVINILVVVFVVQGVSSLAEEIGDETLERRGELIRKLIVIMLTLSIFANLIGTSFFFIGGVMASFAGILGLIAEILSIVYYVIYLIFLGRASKVLKRA